MSEKLRLFTCLAGEKTISFKGTLVKIEGVVDFFIFGSDYKELRISYDNNTIVFRFQNVGLYIFRYTLIYNNVKVDEFDLEGADHFHITIQFTKSYVDVVISYYHVYQEKDVQITRRYEIVQPSGNITITLYRSATDESYCSDFTIEYIPAVEFSVQIAQLIALSIVMGILGSVFMSIRRIVE